MNRRDRSDVSYLFVASDSDFEVTQSERILIEAALTNLLNEFRDIRQDSTELDQAVADYRVSQLERLLEKFEQLGDEENTPVL